MTCLSAVVAVEARGRGLEDCGAVGSEQEMREGRWMMEIFSLCWVGV